MANKKIVSIGFELASDDIEYCEFNSFKSLLDYDIILIQPNINDLFFSYSNYNGKPSLNDDDSAQLIECISHWEKEIKEVLREEKLVVFYMSKLTQVYVATGEKEYSGTGRNQKTTRIIKKVNNYLCLPFDLDINIRNGSKMRLAPNNSEILSTYWNDFENISEYNLTINNPNLIPLLVTKNGNKTVGGLYKPKDQIGNIILLPYIDFESDTFFVEKKDEYVWSSTAKQFASKLIKDIILIQKNINNNSSNTPEPDWTLNQNYKLNKEKELIKVLKKTENKIIDLNKKKSQIKKDISEISKIRGLLYEKGKPLEHSILLGLKILGFKAENYKKDNSEFDVIFESEEGRLLGEAEGKDNRAINVDKIRQLSTNIIEDLDREEVSKPAKGVLFGNAFRLKKLEKRDDPFTEKCILLSNTNSIALIFTPDLFKIVQYLSDNENNEFAESCRKEILNTSGRVIFPQIPE